MRILIGCAFTGILRKKFEEKGHTAMSCDLLPSELPGQHYQGDVRDILCDDWDLLIAFPPCTYLCNSGVRWLHTEKGRWDKMREAAGFFKLLLNANIPKIVIENPIMHKYALGIIGRKYDQIIQPWQFGHGETKATCLWLKNLPKLKPTNIVSGREQRIHKMAPNKDRGKERSKTYEGIAEAVVEQYG